MFKSLKINSPEPFQKIRLQPDQHETKHSIDVIIFVYKARIKS